MATTTRRHASSARRHAAIVFTDIVGYTTMMGSDEDKAFEVLRKNREIHTKFIEQYHGTLIKEMGDGILISFDLASNAVRCAIELQKACMAQYIPLKIGIHEGEMVFESADVLGDGVNVAARIQDGAEEGCILISGSVFRDIKNKADIKTEFLGEKQFKNVDEKIRIYRVNCGEEIPNSNNQSSNQSDKQNGKSTGSNSKKRKLIVGIGGFLLVIIIISLTWFFGGIDGPPSPKASEGKEKTIAVIPFWNDSNDPDNKYFCYGMEEEIRIQLLKISELQIESRQSVEKYRENPDKDVISIGEELGVAYIVEGSVRKIADDVRITIQLIDTKTGNHLWGETYDGHYTVKVLEFQSNTAKQIASSLNAHIAPNEAKRIDHVQTNDTEAYDFLIKGNYAMQLFFRTGDHIHLKNSNNLIDQSLEIDSNYVDALIAKAYVFNYLSNDPDSMNYWLDKALKIDPENPLAIRRKADYYRQTGKFDLAIAYYQKSLQFRPNDNASTFRLGSEYCLQKRDVRKGYPYLMKAMERAIEKPDSYLRLLASTFSTLGEYEKAELCLKAYLKSGKNDCEALQEYQGLLMIIGNYDRALHLTDSICPLDYCDWPCNIQYVESYAYRNEFSTAEQYIRKWEDQRGKQVFTISKGYVYHKMGRIKEAEEVFQEVLKRQAQRLSNTSRPLDGAEYFFRAQILAFQNKKDEALQSIKEIDKMGLNFNLFDRMTHDPMFENLWDDPEFKAILKKVQEEKASVRAQIREMEEQAKLDM